MIRPETREPPLVELEAATFRYGRNVVLQEIDLTLRRSEFTALLGRNGSGKTTLIRGISKLLAPRAGRVVHHRVQDRPLRLGYVPQKESLDPVFPLSVREVVAMGLYGTTLAPFGLSREVRERIAEVLRDTGMLEWERAPFAGLSGGQRQRVLIARALVGSPDLLLLDEPTSGIDERAVEKILELLVDLRRARSLGIVLVSHHFRGLQSRLDRVLWVRERRLLPGSPEDLLRNEHVADMLG